MKSRSARSSFRMIVIALALLAALAVGGCAGDTDTPDQGSDPSDTTPPTDPFAVVAPGLYELPDGRVRAVGYLMNDSELEGGFWFVGWANPIAEDADEDGLPDEGSPDGERIDRIVVIANPSEFAVQLNENAGAYVAVTGTLAEGASIRMAGPEVVVDGIEYLADTAEEVLGSQP